MTGRTSDMLSTESSMYRNDDGIRINGVSKSFGVGEARNEVLRDADLTISSGEFVSLIGPSGCGKSTLLKIVGGLLAADTGHIRIGGETVADATRSKAIGLVPQAPALLPWKNVLENVNLPLRVNKRTKPSPGVRSASELLETFGLGKAIHQYPLELSGGMQQRVAIARAFVFDPVVLLMDEPFSALDEMTRDLQRLELLDFWQSNQKTVLFVTHSVPEAIILSDRIAVMAAHPGQISEIIEVDLKRPRVESDYATESFREKETQVRSALRKVMTPDHV